MSKGKLKILASMVCALCVFTGVTLFSLDFDNTNNVSAQSEVTVLNENMYSYETDNGKHNVYWMRGINAPKMSDYDSLSGTKGYFTKNLDSGYIVYEAPYEENHGYYDLNKNLIARPDESHLCYLGSAGNLLMWWLDQNKQYVDQYVNYLSHTDIYDQEDGLKQIFPFNQDIWDNMYTPPFIELYPENKASGQVLGKTPFITDNLGIFYNKIDSGYCMDRVFDFFINGYKGIDQSPDYPYINNPDNFIKDINGGFFHPIFGKRLISERFSGSEYNTFNFVSNNLRKMFAEGKGVSFGYKVNSGISHAITVWGAEYDENDKLCRIFITDTDDYQKVNENDNRLRGMHGYGCIEGKDGKLQLSNRIGATSGNYIQEIATISLAQDIWEERINDLSDPEKPSISNLTKDATLCLNQNYKLSVDGLITDTGDLSYQWYLSDDINIYGSPIKGETKSYININGGTKAETRYYRCLLTNHKNGKISEVYTTPIKIQVINQDVVNADVPKVTFNASGINITQFSSPSKIYVSAKVNDGGTLSYQWYASSGPSDNLNGWKLPGETNSYFYAPTDKTGRFYYYCEVTNTNKNPEITGEQVVTVKTKHAKYVNVMPAELIDAKAPVISSQPEIITCIRGEQINPIEIIAKSADGGQLSYKWYKIAGNGNEILIEGADSNIFNPDVSVVGITRYKCIVTNYNQNATNNKYGETTSNIITVDVRSDVVLSNDNNLKSLIVSNAVISPAFSSDITKYTANVHVNIDKIDLTAKSAESARVDITNPVLKEGAVTDIVIKVTAENGDVRTYTISVTRGSSHNFGDWIVIKDADCTNEGLEERHCSECDAYETRIIPAKGHKWGSEWVIDKEATCVEPGSKSHHCEICGEKKDVTEIPAKGHTFGNWIVVREADCTNPGEKKHICSDCGFEEVEVIPAKGHKWGSEWVIDKEATCVEAGSKSHHCEICGEKKDVTEIPAKGHNFGDWVVVREATKDHTGLKKRVCSVCGVEETCEIPKLKPETLPAQSGCGSHLIAPNQGDDFNISAILIPVVSILGLIFIKNKFYR